MGAEPPAEKGAAPDARDAAPIVAFDFDGTLTVKDSFIAFLRWRTSRWSYVSRLVRLAPALIRYAADRDRERLKTKAVAGFLRGVPQAALAAEADAFAEIVWPRLMRPDALACWTGWKAEGAVLAIVTASPEATVEPFARRLGADVLLGTRLALDEDGRIAGDLVGRNCRGPEKVARLRDRFGHGFRLVAAYGDSPGDHDMLAAAESPGWRVFKEKPSRSAEPTSPASTPS